MGGIVSAIGSVFSSGVKAVSSVANDLLSAVSPEKPKEEEQAAAPATPPPAPAGNVGPQNADIAARGAQLATLEQTIGQRAANAGAVRNDNEADVLGVAPPAKRRAASRTLLG